jgi:threonine dehydratase
MKLTIFNKVYKKILPDIIQTPLEKYKNNIYLKRESLQKTKSFKWNGVLNEMYTIFDEIVNTNSLKNIYYITTQSTGNHAIATTQSYYFLSQKYSKQYPEHNWTNLKLKIFTNRDVQQKKINEIKKIIYRNKEEPDDIIESSFNNYEEALQAREKLLEIHKGKYVSHGGENILYGHGVIAYEILKKIPNNKSISFYVTVGAGGTVGIGKCMKLLRNNVTFNLVQTTEFSSFIQSVKTNKIVKNDLLQDIKISEGIAVDQPEEFALEIAKECVDNFIIVDTDKVISLILETGLGNSTCIALSGILENDTSDIIVILDCEGNK